MTPSLNSILTHRVRQYEKAQMNLQVRRELLAEGVGLAREAGYSMQQIAEAIGMSRQSVYDLIGGKK